MHGRLGNRALFYVRQIFSKTKLVYVVYSTLPPPPPLLPPLQQHHLHLCSSCPALPHHSFLILFPTSSLHLLSPMFPISTLTPASTHISYPHLPTFQITLTCSLQASHLPFTFPSLHPLTPILRSLHLFLSYPFLQLRFPSPHNLS